MFMNCSIVFVKSFLAGSRSRVRGVVSDLEVWESLYRKNDDERARNFFQSTSRLEFSVASACASSLAHHKVSITRASTKKALIPMGRMR